MRARPVALAAISLCALVGLGFLGYAAGSGATLPTLPQGVSLSPFPLPRPPDHGKPRSAPTRSPAPKHAKPSPTAPTRTAIPPIGGRFTVASGGSLRTGTGALHRYQVTVEDGIGVAPALFARAVEETLADQRGWITSGRWSFQRVGPGAAADFVVRLATPATVDRICGKAGLDTMGEVSCQAGRDVMINLRRWQLGIPAYAGDVRGYQHLVVNHEVGHYLGFGHLTCAGKGKPAPAMMSQYFGLHGCRANPWPYPR